MKEPFDNMYDNSYDCRSYYHCNYWKIKAKIIFLHPDVTW